MSSARDACAASASRSLHKAATCLVLAINWERKMMTWAYLEDVQRAQRVRGERIALLAQGRHSARDQLARRRLRPQAPQHDAAVLAPAHVAAQQRAAHFHGRAAPGGAPVYGQRGRQAQAQHLRRMVHCEKVAWGVMF